MKKKKTVGYASLRQVVLSCMNERDNYGKSEFKRMLQFAIEGFRKFSLYHIPSVEYKLLPVDPDLFSVSFPDDLVKFYAVGIEVEGKFWEFSKVNNNVPPNSNSRNHKPKKPALNYATAPYNQFTFSEETEERRVIIYGPRLTEVLMYYKSTGINADGTTVIPIHAFEALKAYINYKMSVFSTDSESLKERLLRTYGDEVKDMRDFENQFTINEFLDAIRSGYAQSYKR